MGNNITGTYLPVDAFSCITNPKEGIWWVSHPALTVCLSSSHLDILRNEMEKRYGKSNTESHD